MPNIMQLVQDYIPRVKKLLADYVGSNPLLDYPTERLQQVEAYQSGDWLPKQKIAETAERVLPTKALEILDWMNKSSKKTTADTMMELGYPMDPFTANLANTLTEAAIGVTSGPVSRAGASQALKSAQGELYDQPLYHGGPDLGDKATLKTGYYGGKYTGQDSGAIFFTPSEKYARQYSKTADQVSGLYEYKLPKTERIFDINDSKSVDDFIKGAKKWQGYDSPAEAVADAKRMVEQMKATSSKGAADWATASQFIDEIQQSGFTGAKFLERPGENIQQLADGSFKVSGKPVYSYAMFKDEIPVTRVKNVAQQPL